MTDEQLNNTLCLVVVSWERPKKPFEEFINNLLGKSYNLFPLSCPPIKIGNKCESYFTDYLGNVLSQIKAYKHPKSEVRIYNYIDSLTYEDNSLIAVFPREDTKT